MLKFLKIERNAAGLLMVAALIGLVAANSPFSEVIGTSRETFGHFVDTYLMAGFFLLIGLELKRELVSGELSNRKTVTVPALAALFGALVPAGIYVAMVPAGSVAAAGWPIPMATDITFALAVYIIFGSRLPKAARVFLLAFAVIDDLFALAVMGIFLGGSVSPWWFLALLLGLATPIRHVKPVENLVHPWVSLLVLPMFAFYAAAVPLSGNFDLSEPMNLAILLRPVGKILGICLGVWLAMQLLGKHRPKSLSASDYLRLSVLGGIGFTVSILISGTVFTSGSQLANQATIATLVAMLASMLAGAIALATKPKS